MIVPAKKERSSTQFAASDPVLYFFGGIASGSRGITGIFKTKSRDPHIRSRRIDLMNRFAPVHNRIRQRRDSPKDLDARFRRKNRGFEGRRARGKYQSTDR
jgi:hypothetical protein